MGVLNPNQRSNQPQSAGRRKSDLRSSAGGLIQALDSTIPDAQYNADVDHHNASVGNARWNVTRDILHRRVFMNNDSFYEQRPDFLPMLRGHRLGAPESRAGGSGAPFEGSSGSSSSGPGVQQGSATPPQTVFTRPKAQGVNPTQFTGPPAQGIDSGTPAVGGGQRSPMFAPPTPLALGPGG